MERGKPEAGLKEARKAYYDAKYPGKRINKNQPIQEGHFEEAGWPSSEGR